MTTEQKIILDKRTIQRIHHLTALITLAAILFYLFFQVNKGGPFREVNPFGVDPYVAVGSFVFQGAPDPARRPAGPGLYDRTGGGLRAHPNRRLAARRWHRRPVEAGAGAGR